MNSIYEKIHQQIKKAVTDAFLTCANNKSIPQVELPEISVEVPRERGFGDFSTNIVMQVARQIKMPPRKAAELLIQAMDLTGTYIEKVECAGPGFINFYLNRQWLYDALRLIQEKKEHYGELDMGKNIRVNVEFVSANPTGPLHMGNARGGALGDCIASVLKKAGYDVTAST